MQHPPPPSFLLFYYPPPYYQLAPTSLHPPATPVASPTTPTWRGVKLLKFITPDIRRGVKTRSVLRERGEGVKEEEEGEEVVAEEERRRQRRWKVKGGGVGRWAKRGGGRVVRAQNEVTEFADSCSMPVAKQETPLPWQAARGWILNMHCFPVQCRIHIHGNTSLCPCSYGYGGVVAENRAGRERGREGDRGKQQRRGLVMSVERADNGALLDYTDLFGPAGRCKSLLKTSNCRFCPGSSSCRHARCRFEANAYDDPYVRWLRIRSFRSDEGNDFVEIVWWGSEQIGQRGISGL